MKKEHKVHIGIIIVVVVSILLLLSSCKSKMIYVPVESVKTEYRDKYLRDSVYLHDSVFMKIKGDTVWLEKYRYLYRDKFVRDSIFINDSIQVPYPVEIPGPEVNRLTSFQSFQVWCGRILLLLLLAYFGFKGIKRFI
ncbi:hypothetical protein GGR21_002443 [Dysgonomonas hofstadii]|uniref:Uncharacterized protein n=1 Tax=Dysgonomonas hofstadii TaxID=637886 RepID=A0A840CKF1_9BACT|nr:hypothetical protein [Dysgonomonas hofstadii]MBB4036537.1 hypothetical protein [Dysgonomonas hofstadii]